MVDEHARRDEAQKVGDHRCTRLDVVERRRTWGVHRDVAPGDQDTQAGDVRPQQPLHEAGVAEGVGELRVHALHPPAGVEVGGLELQVRAVDRDDRGWVLSVAHMDVVPFAQVEPALGGPVTLEAVGTTSGLAFDHDEIVRFAAQHVRREHETGPDPFGLLPESFTLLDLRRLHEAVAGEMLVKDTFRRRMQHQLTETGETREGVVGKPARLWVRRA